MASIGGERGSFDIQPIGAGRPLSGQCGYRHLLVAKSPWFDCCDLLPSGESCLPVTGRFPVSHPPMWSARGFLPSRARPARARARMRPPRLRQRAMSPIARCFSECNPTPWHDFSSANSIDTRKWTRLAAILGPRCPPANASRPSPRADPPASLEVGWLANTTEWRTGVG
jgi:hypothetical protein